MIDRNTVDRIVESAQILDVVSDFVTLKKKGVNYVGLCPFHDDKTPSFYVSPAKGLCKCFSCGKGGNPVHFIMEHEQCTYPEALRYLAKKYHIEIEERELTAEEKQSQSVRESLFVVNEYAKEYFRNTLFNHIDGKTIGMAYFRSRGVRDDIVQKFQLGYCTQDKDALAKEAVRRGYQKDFLLKTGLCYAKDDGSLRDRFWGRVIFPWINVSGKVVGFGGRVLDSRTKGVQQKYVNSPESEIFSKRRELYGLYQAKSAIVKNDCVYMVEGYTDVIAMHQCGLENVVANSGTALSEEQIRLLRRFTSNITLIYDGDEAGIKASIRGIDMLLAEGMNVRVLLLPDGDDPDSFARKHNATQMQDYIASKSENFIRFKTNLLMKDAQTDPVKRASLIADMAHSIGLVPDEIMRYAYLKECASILSADERIIQNEIKKVVQQRRDSYLEKRLSNNSANDGNSLEIVRDSLETVSNSWKSLEIVRFPPENTGESLEKVRFPSESTGESLEIVRFPLNCGKELELARVLVRYGEKQVCTVKGEGGEDVPISVAEYIYYDMAQDKLRFQGEVINRMLEEVMQRIGEEGFTAEHFFVSHPDPEISTLAVELASDRFQLSRVNEQNHTSDDTRLNELVPHLIMEYKLSVLKEESKALMQQLSSPEVSADPQRCMEIMKRYKELTEIIKELSKLVGERVVV